MERTVLVTGATGKQGGAVARHLLRRGGFVVKAMTRKPDSDAAQELRGLGAQIVEGDLDDDSSLARALQGAWGVFAVQNTWEAGVEREEEQGKRQARVAKEAGVQHYVYTSVGSAHRSTGIPHFDNKWHIEQTVRELGFPSHTIIRPVFFMENLISPWFMQGDKLMAALDPKTRVQMIAVDDIGKFGARAFERAGEMKGLELDIAGDELTIPEAARILGEAMERPIEFVRLPIEAVRQQSEDFATMLEWFESVGYDADIASLESKYGIRPMRFGEWARDHAK